MKDQPIILEKVFDAPAQKVWEAITENLQMQQWYFVLPEFNAKTGFEFQFYGGKTGEKQYLHLCEVTEVIPGKKLTYSWRYDGYQGISFVTFELIEEGNKTKLILTHSDLETFKPTNPDFEKENFVIGWTHILNVALGDFLMKG
jgi:uncharacterized protein YndB with AHSA1/START domain